MGRRKRGGNNMWMDGEYVGQDRDDWGGNYEYPSYKGYKKDDGWDTGDEVREAKDCSFCPGKDGFNISIDQPVMAAIFGLCETIKDEWQMFLKGSVVDRLVLIDGYYVPKQEVTGASVKNLDVVDQEFIAREHIVATIHSHSSMGVFFSATDDEFTNMSFIKHHIVVNNNHSFVAKSRVDLPCGMVKFMNSTVHVTTVPTVAVVGIEKIGRKSYGGYKQQGGWIGQTPYVGLQHKDRVAHPMEVHKIVGSDGKAAYFDYEWEEITEQVYNLRVNLLKK